MKCLLHSNESEEDLYRDIVNSTIGVIFLGTPLRGSTLANWGSLGLDYVHLMQDVNRDIVKLLEPGSDVLFQLRDSFLKLVKARAARPASAIIIKCYAEELGKTLIGKVRSPSPRP
jgi:protein SERAC1